MTLTINDSNRQLSINGIRIRLSKPRFRLFKLLHERMGDAVPAAEIRTALFGEEQHKAAGTMRVQITYLRKCIAPLGFKIVSTRGYGYGLEQT